MTRCIACSAHLDGSFFEFRRAPGALGEMFCALCTLSIATALLRQARAEAAALEDAWHFTARGEGS